MNYAKRLRRIIRVEILCASLFIILIISATGCGAKWAATYGGPDTDRAYSIRQTSDGGYIVAGHTDFSVNGSPGDIWVLKLDSSGDVQWQNNYGGSGMDIARSVQETTDGGYVVTGYTWSYGAGYRDIWVLKFDSSGAIQWQKTYGGSEKDGAQSIQQTADGGYIVAGSTESFGAGLEDVWVLKLDSTGNVQWQKAYGGEYKDFAHSIQQTGDGGYIATGFTEASGDTGMDYWVLKLDSSGNIEWHKTYGGDEPDYARSVQQTTDGGYIVAGTSESFGPKFQDVWVLRLDSDGDIQWQKAYGGNAIDMGMGVLQTSEGGYIVGATSESIAYGINSFWILKLDTLGNVPWQKAYYEVQSQSPNSLLQSIGLASDTGYIAAGITKLGVDPSDFGDFWVIKLSSDGNTSHCDFSVSTSGATPIDTGAAAQTFDASIADTTVVPQDSQAIAKKTNVKPDFDCE